jgi:hypothetical protein
MYEMEGPRPVRSARAPIARPLRPTDLLPVPNTHVNRWFPGSCRVPEVAPGPVSVSGSESISTPLTRTAQGGSAADSKIL